MIGSTTDSSCHVFILVTHDPKLIYPRFSLQRFCKIDFSLFRFLEPVISSLIVCWNFLQFNERAARCRWSRTINMTVCYSMTRLQHTTWGQDCERNVTDSTTWILSLSLRQTGLPQDLFLILRTDNFKYYELHPRAHISIIVISDKWRKINIQLSAQRTWVCPLAQAWFIYRICIYFCECKTHRSYRVNSHIFEFIYLYSCVFFVHRIYPSRSIPGSKLIVISSTSWYWTFEL